MPLRKGIADLTEDDLRSLIENQEPEGKEIEYKLHLPGGSPDDKKEFLKDATSFANTVGGYLLYGIREAQGVPVELAGLTGIDTDKAILRLEQMLQAGVAPRIPMAPIRAIPLSSSAVIIALHFPRSWAGPHMVTLGGSSKFFGRNSGGVYQLDVFELRTAFTASETAVERIRSFRTERLGKILSGEAPVQLASSALMVLHVVPLGATDPRSHYDLESVCSQPSTRSLFTPLSRSHASQIRHNFDGVVAWTPAGTPTESYLQVFRNSAIESVDTYLLRPRGIASPDGSETYIPSGRLRPDLVAAVQRYTDLLSQMGVGPPLLLGLSLLSVRGYWMFVDQWQPQGELIDRDHLIVPEILIEDLSEPATELLQPALDAIWQACGFARDLSASANGLVQGGGGRSAG